MNVLHFFTRYLPPTENWAYNLLKSADGVSHHVFARQFILSPSHDPSFRFLQLPGGFRAPSRSLYRGPASVIHTALSITPWVPSRLITSGGRRAGIDVLHAHFAHNGWRYRRVAAGLELPLAVSFYGYDYEYLPYTNPRWKARYRRLFSEAALFLCEGSFGAGKLVEMGCPPEKVRVQHLGIDTGRIPLIERRKKPGSLRLVQIAWLNEKKGQIDALEAFALAAERCPNATLTFVGTEKSNRGRPGIRKELVRLIETHRLADRVTLIDSVDYGRLYEFLAGYDVFIHPSRYSSKRDCEGGAPVVLLDAQATGMPVISTMHCDIPEEVVHDRTGMLAPEGDIPTLARFIEDFYEMGPEDIDRFAREARAHVVEHYDLSACGRSLTGHYASLAGSQTGERPWREAPATRHRPA